MLRFLGLSIPPFHTVTRRSGSGKGNGCSSVAFTTLNIVVFAPMPSARVNTDTVANPGLRIHMRTANRTSLRKVSIPAHVRPFVRRRSRAGRLSRQGVSYQIQYRATDTRLKPG